jgi:outer membrane immunogenic protein
MYRREAAVGGYKDGPVYAVNTWTGFYAGVNGGYGWNANGQTLGFTSLSTGRTQDPFPGPELEGGFGGGQIGYNFGSLGLFGPQFVFGIEADFQGSGISDSYGTAAGFIPLRVESDLNWFGTVRGRIGFAFDRTLVYATGGFAYGDIETLIRFDGGGKAAYRADDTLTGYAVGGGIEHKLSPNWSLKAEYQYIDLGQYSTGKGVTPGGGPTSFRVRDVDADFHTVRAGLNYHFGSTYESLK